jgi:tetratricopeptide (TPR) repeat protein
VLELSAEYDTAFAERVEPLVLTGSTLLEPPKRFGGGVSIQEAVEAALRRTLEQARRSVRACRDARLGVRPETGSAFEIELMVNGRGEATRVHVTLAGAGRDAVLERCVEGVVASLPYVAAGVTARLSHTLRVPESRAAGRTRCSGAARVSLPLRKALWRARRPLDASAYVRAQQGCELGAWSDRRALLLLMLEDTQSGVDRLTLARQLDDAGEDDAATFLRSETLRRIQSFSELEALSQILTRDEPNIDAAFEAAYRKAGSNAERFLVTENFLRLAPHNGLARRRELGLLEATQRHDELLQRVRLLRSEPIIDAGLVAQGASALRRIGHEAEGLRTFGDLIERAPRDPWTLGYVGDRLRAEGMFDEAQAAYERLQSAVPDDAGVTLRLALAHAGAGRLDVATRLLERVTQTGGRGDDGRAAELAAITRAVLLASARDSSKASERELLERRLLQTPLPDALGVVLVRWAPSDDPIEVRVQRERGEELPETPDFDASSVGIAAFRIERGDGAAKVLLRRASDAGPTRPARASVAALVLTEDGSEARLLPKEVSVEANGKDVELTLDRGAWL